MHDQPAPLQALRPTFQALAHIVALPRIELSVIHPRVSCSMISARLAPASATARQGRTARYLAAAAVVTLAVVIGMTWVMVRRSQSAALIEQSLPEIERLAGLGQYVDAYRLGQRAANVSPGDPRVQRALGAATAPLNMKEPVGADVYFKDYTVSMVVAASRPCSVTGGRIPKASCGGDSSGRVRHGGRTSASGSSRFVEREGAFWNGCTCVEGCLVMGRRRPVAGLLDGQVESRMANSSDLSTPAATGAGNTGTSPSSSPIACATGPASPARPRGSWARSRREEDYPVSGVSGTSHSTPGCRQATAHRVSLEAGDRERVVRPGGASAANFNGKSTVSETELKDLGTYGTYGLAGNVKEWIWNATDDRRYVVGGAWNDPPYMAINREARSPLDRHQTHGFRCVRDVSPLPAAALEAIPPRSAGRTDKPVGDDLYAVYKALSRTIVARSTRGWNSCPRRSIGAPSSYPLRRPTDMSACPSIFFCRRTRRRHINLSSGFRADTRSALFRSVPISAVRRVPRTSTFSPEAVVPSSFPSIKARFSGSQASANSRGTIR